MDCNYTLSVFAPETNIGENILTTDELCDLLRIPREKISQEKENINPTLNNYYKPSNTILK